MASLGFSKVGTPSLRGGGYNLPKIESLGGGGVQIFFLERGDKPVKGRLMLKWEGVPLFYYFTVQSYLLRVRGK